MPSSASAPQPTIRTSQMLPIEIWTIVLELTIHVPRLLDTACTDVSFVQYSGLGSRLYNSEMAYCASKQQRLILQNVCSAWRVWADLRKNRYIVMTDKKIPLEAVLNAVRVPLLPRVPMVEI